MKCQTSQGALLGWLPSRAFFANFWPFFHGPLEILVVCFFQLLVPFQPDDLWGSVGQPFHPFLNSDKLTPKCVPFCFHAGKASALTSQILCTFRCADDGKTGKLFLQHV